MTTRTSIVPVAAGAAALLLAGSVWMASAKDEAAPPTLDQLQQETTALLAQSQALRDEKDIEKLQRKYGYYIDKKMWNEAAALFADDATYEPGHTGIYVGKASIRHAMDQDGPQGIKDGELFNHMQLQGIVHVAADGNSAQGRWRSLIQLGEYGKSAYWREGIYENEYVKRDGAWKIHKLHFYPNFTTAYDKGWGKEVIPEPTVAPKGFETDRPASLTYRAFPKYFVAPFHYPNPVTGQPPLIGKLKQTGNEQ